MSLFFVLGAVRLRRNLVVPNSSVPFSRPRRAEKSRANFLPSETMVSPSLITLPSSILLAAQQNEETQSSKNQEEVKKAQPLWSLKPLAIAEIQEKHVWGVVTRSEVSVTNLIRRLCGFESLACCASGEWRLPASDTGDALELQTKVGLVAAPPTEMVAVASGFSGRRRQFPESTVSPGFVFSDKGWDRFRTLPLDKSWCDSTRTLLSFPMTRTTTTSTVRIGGVESTNEVSPLEISDGDNDEGDEHGLDKLLRWVLQNY
nr:uncharacterized protein LOC108337025 [Ipomoea batatas]